MPTTRAPKRQTALRFLTSAPLIIPNRTNKKNTIKISQNVDEQTVTRKQPANNSFKTDRKQTPKKNCKDHKYSCIFWIKAHRNVCIEQKNFMRVNCAFTCDLCEE